MEDAQIALAASPRDWAQRLHRHVADHGGARVRATVLHASDALNESYDVFVVDDTTSFLTHHLLDELHRIGRRVLGVYDPQDGRGKGELLDRGVDDVIVRDAPAEAFLAVIHALSATATRDRPMERGEPLTGRGGESLPVRGRITVVGGPSGGVGATEVAIALCDAVASRGTSAVLVDADEVAPSVAQRLGLPLYPNIRAAIDAVEHRTGSLSDALIAVPGAAFAAIPGLSAGRDWAELRPNECVDAAKALAMMRDEIIVNVAHRIEDLHASVGLRRYGQSRALLGVADDIVAVGLLTPVGVARLLDWVAELRVVAPNVPLHLVLNRAPKAAFKRAEAREEILRSIVPATLSFAPDDRRVEAAAWSGGVVARGPFAKSMRALADTVLPTEKRRRSPTAVVSR